jgi:hypothetical protein
MLQILQLRGINRQSVAQDRLGNLHGVALRQGGPGARHQQKCHQAGPQQPQGKSNSRQAGSKPSPAHGEAHDSADSGTNAWPGSQTYNSPDLIRRNDLQQRLPHGHFD